MKIAQLSCSKCRTKIPVVFGMVSTLTCQSSGCGGNSFRVEIVKEPISLTCVACGRKVEAMGGAEISTVCRGCGSRVFTPGIANPDFKLLLIIRNRGIGDVLMTTAALPRLRMKYPDHAICYAVDPDVEELLLGNPYIDFRLPTDRGVKLTEWDIRIDLRQKVEDYAVGDGVNKGDRLERFMKLCGVPVPPVPKMEIYLTREERKWAETFYPVKRNLIVLGLTSASRFRAWPLGHFRKLTSMIDRNKCDVLLLSDTAICSDWFGAGIINATGRLTIRQMCSLIERSSLVISGDTGVSHIAAAFDKPAITLYGAIPPEVRCGHYPLTIPIYKEGIVPCVPCWDWQFATDEHLRKCKNEGPDCLLSISPEEVFEKLKEVLK